MNGQEERGQVKLGGMALTCTVQVRRAGVSQLPVYASEEEKALNSPAVVLLSTSGDGAYEESFLDCPPARGLLFNNPACEWTLLLGGEGGKIKQKIQK